MDLSSYTTYLEFGAALLAFVALLYKTSVFLVKGWSNVDDKKSKVVIALNLLLILIFIVSLVLLFNKQLKGSLLLMVVAITIMYILFFLEKKIKKLDVIAMIFISSGTAFMGSAYFSMIILKNQIKVIETQQNLIDNQKKLVEVLKVQLEPKIEEN